MIRGSVLEGNSARVSKICIWVLSAGLIVFISIVGLFLGLTAMSFSKESLIKDSSADCNRQISELNTKITELKAAIVQGQARKASLTTNFTTETANNEKLKKENETTTQELKNMISGISAANTQLMICGVAGGISILLNGGTAAFALMTNPKINVLQPQADYLKQRYVVGVSNTLEHILNAKERLSWHKLKPLFNSTVAFTKSAFVTNTTAQSNTITLIQTTNEEAIGYVMHSPWDYSTGSIVDNTAFTYSFRKYNKTLKIGESPAVHTDKGFIQIGEEEVFLDTTGKGRATVGKGYNPPKTQNDPKDFYCAAGEFTLAKMLVYQFV